MKKAIALSILFLMLLGICSVPAQTTAEKLTGIVWVLQNPQIASQWESLVFVDNGKLLYCRTNITKQNSPMTEYTGVWEITDKKKGQVLLNINDIQILVCIGIVENRLLVTELTSCQLFFFSKANSPDNQYVNMAAIAMRKYGENATLKNCVPGPSCQGASYFIP